MYRTKKDYSDRIDVPGPLMLVSIFVIVSVLNSCFSTQRHYIGIDSGNKIAGICFPLRDSLRGFQADGTMSGAIKKERFKGDVTVSFSDSTGFNLTMYSPFAQTMALISSKDDSAQCEMGGRITRIGIHDSVNSFDFFSMIPFTLSDLIRIITGVGLKDSCSTSKPDSIKVLRKNKVYYYKKDSFLIAVTTHKEKTVSVVYTNTGGKPWELKIASIKDGIGKVICFHDGEMNYFSLVYDRMTY
jgi:hypothetical protein